MVVRNSPENIANQEAWLEPIVLAKRPGRRIARGKAFLSRFVDPRCGIHFYVQDLSFTPLAHASEQHENAGSGDQRSEW
jgi:hypothetical protein